MAWAEFEEKEYEVAAIVELGRRGDVFGAGQVLEAIVGYDAAARPDRDHVIWRILDVPRPRGLRLVPAYWQPGPVPAPDALPRSLVSLILQYKRPEYLHGWNAQQWKAWQRPYFRFARRRNQQSVLVRLERSLRGTALVRYAAPAFWLRGELEKAQLEQQVLARSGYVQPTAIEGHTAWTYVEPGVKGHANPEVEWHPFETLDSLLLEAAGSAAEAADGGTVPPPGLAGHLAALGAAASGRNVQLRRKVLAWREALRAREILVSDETLKALGDLAAIVTVTATLGASWHVLKPSP